MHSTQQGRRVRSGVVTGNDKSGRRLLSRTNPLQSSSAAWRAGLLEHLTAVQETDQR